MNTKFQIQIKVFNWEGGSSVICKEITLNDIAKFTDFAKAINTNSGKEIWNWFGDGNGLPTKWDGTAFVLDTWNLCHTIEKNFGYKVTDVNLIKEFYLRFTPNGADAISNIKFFKVEEIEF